MRVVIAIDPGAPKKEHNFGTTGVFVGELAKLKRLEGHSLKIPSSDIDGGIRETARTIRGIYDKYKAMEYVEDVIVVLEEYKNYGFNQSANFYSSNTVSQVIGAIKSTVGEVVEQPTLNIKTGFNNEAIEGKGLISKVGNRWVYNSGISDVPPSSRHELDAFRHYLLYRKNNNYLNIVIDKNRRFEIW